MALAAIVAAAPTAALAVDPDRMLDGFAGVFGNQKARSSGAKGQCFVGTFTPSADVAKLTKASSLTQAGPIVGRFSMGGGNPKIADTAKAAVRGLSLRIGTGTGRVTELVTISAPMFFAKTPEQMLGFLQARALGPDKKMDPEKIKAFAAANPETTRQGAWLSSKPVPASYVGVSYWAVHAYTLTNAQGAVQIAKLKLLPTGGEAGLTDEEAKGKPADFLVEELSARLAKGERAGFTLVAVPAQPGDATSDPTQMWADEEKRATMPLGTITVTGLERNEVCDADYFDPANLADGIAGPKDDPMFGPRKPTYSRALNRRAN